MRRFRQPGTVRVSQPVLLDQRRSPSPVQVPLRRASRHLLRLAAVLAAASAACRLAFHVIGARLDATGMLREMDALLPISYLLLLASLGLLAAVWVLQRRVARA